MTIPFPAPTPVPNPNEAATRRTLGAINLNATTATTQAKAFYGTNLSGSTLTVRMPMTAFAQQSAVGNARGPVGTPITQRPLDSKHARGLAIYMLKGLVASVTLRRAQRGEEELPATVTVTERLGRQPYFGLQPIVANLRNLGPGGANLQAEELRGQDGEPFGLRVWLGQQDVLWVIDGQHRRQAMQSVLDFLEAVRLRRSYPPLKDSLYSFDGPDREVPDDELELWMECFEVARTSCSISVEVHLGLDPEQERQLFHDLNRLGKKVDTNLALEFDNSNPVNLFIKEELVGHGVIDLTSDQDRSMEAVNNWGNDSGGMKRKDLVAINAILFLNKTNINGAVPALVNDRISTAKEYWQTITQIPGFGEPGARKQTVAAQPVVLKAIAKLTYDYAFGRAADPALLQRLLDGIGDVDFAHDNPMWRFYELTEEERAAAELTELEAYLPSMATGNRDIGKYNESNSIFIFGAKHNDIHPIIGDMIRWKLGLPNRHDDALTAV
jgi:hypothetical protein